MTAASRRLAIAALAGLAGCDQIFQIHAPEPADAAAGDGPGQPADASVDARRDAGRDAAPPTGCPGTYVATITGWYRYVTAVEQWQVAAAICASDAAAAGAGVFTHLVVIGNDAERVSVEAVMDPSGTWIGRSDRVSPVVFRWVTQEDTLGYAPPWQAGQPDNGGGGGQAQDCVRWRSTGYDDYFCNVPQPFLCECDGYADDPSQY